MSEKLNDLINKLYKDGIDKTKIESADILKSAEKEKNAILQEAKKQAENFMLKAETEANDIKTRLTQDMQFAKNNIITELKDNISNIIADKTLTKSASSNVLKSDEFIKEMLIALVKSWAPNDDSDFDITLKFSKDNQSLIKDFVSKQFPLELKKGLQIDFDDRENGFAVISKGDSFKVEFDENTVTQFFKDRLKPFTKDILFKN